MAHGDPGPVIVARTATPEGHEIVLTALRWAKIIDGHPETVDYLEAILQTVSEPDHREPDLAVGRERMFRRVGPERWMRVVVDLEQIITAFPQSNDPV